VSDLFSAIPEEIWNTCRRFATNPTPSECGKNQWPRMMNLSEYKINATYTRRAHNSSVVVLLKKVRYVLMCTPPHLFH
jgi:hypothetical protein